MRSIDITTKRIKLTDEVETIYEKTVTPFGNSAKIDTPKKHRGQKAYIIILKK